MTKKSILVLAAALVAAVATAQTVTETTTTVGTLTVPAYTVSFDKEARLVQDATNQRLKDMKLKTKKSEGYTAALEQVVADIAPNSINLYTKVEEQGKKKERQTVLTVCAISNDLTIDQAAMRAGVRRFAEGMAQYVARYEAQRNMDAELENLKRAEKAATAAAAAVTGLEKDIASAEKKIADKQAEIEKLNARIKTLEGEIKGLQGEIEKNTGKRDEAVQKSAEAQQAVKGVEGEVERYRQAAQ